MQGTIIIMQVNGATKFLPIDGSPTLDELRCHIGGGWIEEIPGWNKFPFNKKFVPALVFGDEEAKLKSMPVNDEATRMWHALLRMNVPSIDERRLDSLRGDIVIIIGDDILRAMRDDGDSDEQGTSGENVGSA